MDFGNVCAMAVEYFGADCFLQIKGAAEGKTVRMVVRPGVGQNGLDGRAGMSRVLESSLASSRAQTAAAMLLAKDAPQGMHEQAELHVIDSQSKMWRMDRASEVRGSNPETGREEVVAWRMVLRQAQELSR